MRARLTECLKKVIMTLMAVLLGALLVGSVLMTVDVTELHNTFRRDNMIVNIIMIIVVVALGVYVKDRKLSFSFTQRHWKIIAAAVVGIVAAAACLWLYMTQLKPEFDQRCVETAAAGLLQSDASQWDKGEYMDKYPNNNGIVLFIYGIYRIIGRNAMAIQYLNVVFWIISIAALYGCARQWKADGKVNAAAVIISALFLPYVLYVTYVYGVIFGMAFALLGCMFLLQYLNKRSWWQLVLSAVCIGVACLLKQNYLIMLAALVVLLFMDFAAQKNYWNLLGCVLMIGLYMLGSSAVNVSIEKMTNRELSKGIPTTAWVALGLRWEYEESPGWWDDWTDYNYVKNGSDSEKMNEQSVEMIQFRLKTLLRRPRYATRFFFLKLSSQWNNPTYESLSIYRHRESNTEVLPQIQAAWDGESGLYHGLIDVMDRMQTLILLGAFAWAILERKRVTLKELLFAIAFLGGFLFHTVWEAKAMYAATYMFIMVPYAAQGYDRLFERLAEVVRTRRTNNSEQNK